MRRPSAPVLAVGGVFALALGFAVFLHDDGPNLPEGAPIASQALRFEDRLDGAVAVYAGDATQPSAMLAPNSNHFVRALMRSLARERRIQETGVAGEAPFRLTLYPDGRLILEDPTTSRMLDLRAYGQTNAMAFAQLLPAPEVTR